mmetsp:Transcript_6173/g.17385  ORF Transcript_6173/g.17385 Transcript_6173/m.17385 type:complete len:208 (-) Transcript_6173:119-742(-)
MRSADSASSASCLCTSSVARPACCSSAACSCCFAASFCLASSRNAISRCSLLMLAAAVASPGLPSGDGGAADDGARGLADPCCLRRAWSLSSPWNWTASSSRAALRRRAISWSRSHRSRSVCCRSLSRAACSARVRSTPATRTRPSRTWWCPRRSAVACVASATTDSWPSESWSFWPSSAHSRCELDSRPRRDLISMLCTNSTASNS